MEAFKKLVTIPLLLALVLAYGCTTRLTAKQQLLWAANVWEAQYDMYLDQIIDPSIVAEDIVKLKADPSLITSDMIRPDLTNDERKILNEKLDVLVEAKKYLDTANQLRKQGEVPPAELQKNITNLINTLVGED